MSAVQEWAKAKPTNNSTVAILLARSAENVSEALTEMRNMADMLLPQPPLEQWLFYYKNHRSILSFFRKLLDSDKFESNSDVINFKQIIEHDTALQNWLVDIYRQPETLYFLKVWAPCIIFYNTTPTKLYRQARLGKISAFEKLLRIDNSIIFDQRLSELFHQIKGKANKRNYRKLAHAFVKPATKKVDIQKIKYIISGLISHISTASGHRFTEPKIRGLFDAIAQDDGLGGIDTDLPDSSDTYAQAIRRQAKIFSKISKT